MHLAYIVSAYRYPRQLARLVARLEAPQASFFIHVDRSTPEDVFRAMVEEVTARAPRAVFVPRHRSSWGSFGHVEASLEGIRAALESRLAFDRAVLLTGQDYPIKPNSQIFEFFSGNPLPEYIEYFPLPHAGWQGMGLDRIEAWHVRLGARHVAVRPPRFLGLRRRTPGGLRPFGGSSYWCLSRTCLENVMEYVTEDSSLVRFFRRVDVPDELFFQTIILNSTFASRVVNDNLRFILWEDVASASPTILGMRHFNRLAASPALFARKFDATVDEEILDAIDERLLSGTAKRGPEQVVGGSTAKATPGAWP